MLSALRNFLLTFAIAALIFGIIAYAVSGFIVETTNNIGVKDDNAETLDIDVLASPADTSVTDSEASVPDTADIEGESFNVLFIGSDYRKSLKSLYNLESTTNSDQYFAERDLKPQIDFLMIMKVDKENCRFVLCYVPTNIRVIKDGAYTEIRELYAGNNEQEIKSYVEANTGVNIDYYLNLSIDSFEHFVSTVIDRLNGFSYSAPCDIVIEDTFAEKYSIDTYKIEIKKNDKINTAEEALALLRFKDYSSSKLSRESVSLSFMQAMLEAYTKNRQGIDVYKSLLSFIINNNYGNTNITGEDIEKNLDLLFMYPEFETVTVAMPGSYISYKDHRTENESKSYFVPDISQAVDALG